MVAAPLSDADLASHADLVVEARVLSRSNGRASISLRRIIKGTPRLQTRGWLHRLGLRRTVIVEYRSQPSEPGPGDWWNEGAFSPGNRIRAYLAWNARAGCYEAVWWNGIEILR